MSNENLLLRCYKCGIEIEAKRDLLDLSDDDEDENGNHRLVGEFKCPNCYEINGLDFWDDDCPIYGI